MTLRPGKSGSLSEQDEVDAEPSGEAETKVWPGKREAARRAQPGGYLIDEQAERSDDGQPGAKSKSALGKIVRLA
jgi:hypothetical protein